jgi:tetratricopeptide (TPR) repeat protein
LNPVLKKGGLQFNSINLFSQNNLVDLKNLNLELYRTSLKSGDYNTGIIALNYLVQLELKSGKYQDSLAFLYFSAGNFYQSIFWCNEVLKNKPNDLQVLEIKASSLRQTNQLIQSIEIYEHLFTQEKNPIYIFNLIELQYQIKRLIECVSSTLKAEMIDTKDINYTYKVSDNNILNTSLKAAILNYQGLAYFELQQFSNAKESFEKSNNIDSTFILAKSNLDVINNLIDNNNSKFEINRNSNITTPILKKED